MTDEAECKARQEYYIVCCAIYIRDIYPENACKCGMIECRGVCYVRRGILHNAPISPVDKRSLSSVKL